MKKRYVIEFTVEAEDCSDEWIEDQALQELTCMSPFPEDIDFYRKDSSWHTETPTEEGWYLFQFEDRFGFWFKMQYLDLDAIERLTKKNLLDDTVWQKIEPYKDTKEKKK